MTQREKQRRKELKEVKEGKERGLHSGRETFWSHGQWEHSGSWLESSAPSTQQLHEQKSFHRAIIYTHEKYIPVHWTLIQMGWMASWPVVCTSLWAVSSWPLRATVGATQSQALRNTPIISKLVSISKSSTVVLPWGLENNCNTIWRKHLSIIRNFARLLWTKLTFKNKPTQRNGSIQSKQSMKSGRLDSKIPFNFKLIRKINYARGKRK